MEFGKLFLKSKRNEWKNDTGPKGCMPKVVMQIGNM